MTALWFPLIPLAILVVGLSGAALAEIILRCEGRP